MITPWQGPSDLSHALEHVRHQAEQWQRHSIWSPDGLARWQLVLELALPPLPGVNARFSLEGHAWRGVWVHVEGCPALWMQRRAGREGLSPWFLWPLVPLEASQQPAFWATRLNHLEMAFSILTPAQSRISFQHLDLGGRLSGPSWALLSGRARAEQMLQPTDFHSR